MTETIIIIGGVAAGAKAAAKARRQDPTANISIFTEENYISYSACGLPYYIEDVIKDSKKLLIRSPETFRDKENIEINLNHRVIRINPNNKTIVIQNLINNSINEVEYTKLLIATGAKPYIPKIEGTQLKNVFTLRSVTDGMAIKEHLNEMKKAVIVGGGLIGLEMVEAFSNVGLEVTLIEKREHILSVMDKEIATQVEEYLIKEKGIKIQNNTMLTAINGENTKVKSISTNKNETIEADIVLLSIGVTPEIELAKAAGIEIGKSGAIKVDYKMETSMKDIFAAGDCAEQMHIITGKPVWYPLGSTANKQGRVAAINMTGGHEGFRGVLGSLVTKVFDYTISKTGLSEKEALDNGYEVLTAITSYRDRAGYMPGAEKITIKVIADKNTKRLLGCQAIGKGDADKRVNVVAAAITAGMTVDQFMAIDLTYAPPYSPSIDPILITVKMLTDED